MSAPHSSTYDLFQDALSSNRLEIRKIPSETEWVDVMEGCTRHEISVQNHGFVALVDVLPRLVPVGQTADYAIVQAARVSYGAGTKRVNEDRGLIRYLSRHRHSTPFEMIEFKFHIRMPIFVARQFVRHRTANINEYSARYSIVQDLFYRPDRENIRMQSQSNRQGGEAIADESTAEEFLAYLDEMEKSYTKYEDLIESGLSREQARIGLPLSCYTEWYWKCDLHNIFHFLSLRMDSHAQSEIRDYAMAMFALIKDIVPIACEAFVDYRLEGMFLTRLEVDAIRNQSSEISNDNKREQKEFESKLATLGLDGFSSTALQSGEGESL